MVAAGYFGVEWSRSCFAQRIGATKCDSEGRATNNAESGGVLSSSSSGLLYRFAVLRYAAVLRDLKPFAQR
jgi:hypothetical protein